jgi:hypothetical protein
VGYCSPKRGGTAEARVTIKGLTVNEVGCTFSAQNFTGGCGAHVFDPAQACNGRQCGGLIGCGACAAGGCCDGSLCVGESKVGLDEPCASDWRCDDGLACVTGVCKGTLAAGASCGMQSTSCEPAVAYCAGAPGSQTCVDALDVGYKCGSKVECTSLHCRYPPDFQASPDKYCAPMAELFTACGDGSVATCEPGTYCSAGKCVAQTLPGQPCADNVQCLSGQCIMGGAGKVCTSPNHCFGLAL